MLTLVLLLASIHLPFLIAAAASTPPDLTGIAAIITACIGVVGFLATFARGRANNKRVEEVEHAASYVKGFDSLIDSLQAEIDAVRKDQKDERDQFGAEREAQLEVIRRLRGELSEAVATQAVTRGELAEVKGQIKGFLDPDQYEAFLEHLD
ncbi:MAG: hypothetical protein ACRDPE_15780 [Solirubrobacterales bacterium]